MSEVASYAVPIPDPDPSSLTTELVDKAIVANEKLRNAELKTIYERFRSLDEANKLLSENVNRVPTALQVAVKALEALENVKFDNIKEKFADRDRQSERDIANNVLSVNAAITAQKEAAQAQNTTNLEAIRKSEEATKSELMALANKIEDDRVRMARMEEIQFRNAGIKAGGAAVYAALATGIVILLTLIGLIVAIITRT